MISQKQIYAKIEVESNNLREKALIEKKIDESYQIQMSLNDLNKNINNIYVKHINTLSDIEPEIEVDQNVQKSMKKLKNIINKIFSQTSNILNIKIIKPSEIVHVVNRNASQLASVMNSNDYFEYLNNVYQYPVFINHNTHSFREGIALQVNLGIDVNDILIDNIENPSAVKYLLSKGASPNCRAKPCPNFRNNEPALLCAIIVKSLKSVKILIESGADLESQNSKGINPMNMAIFIGSVDILKTLISKGAKIKNESSDVSYLHLASFCSSSLVPCLIEAGINVDIQDKNGSTPLMKASPSSIPYLLKYGADINKRDHNGQNVGLYQASSNTSTMEVLKSAGLDLNSSDNDGTTLLMDYIGNNDEIVLWLIDNWVDLEKRDKKKWTPIFYAVDDENMKITKRLIEAGAEVNVKDYKLNTPLHLAVSKGNIQLIKILLDNGADINASNLNGSTPLFFSIKCNEAEQFRNVVLLLCNNGAYIDHQDRKGNTFLSVLAAESIYDYVKILIELGADPNSVNYFGFNILIQQCEKKKIREIFFESGVSKFSLITSFFNSMNRMASGNRILFEALIFLRKFILNQQNT